jgi:hypothetical protein
MVTNGSEFGLNGVKEENKVILSRDVQFEEKPGCCIEQVKLPFQDVNIKVTFCTHTLFCTNILSEINKQSYFLHRVVHRVLLE